MTDTDTSNEQPAAARDPHARASAHETRRQAVFPGNRAAVFDALECQGIEAVTVSFDGYGDSGQIGDVFITGGAPCDLAAIQIEQKRADWRTEAVETVTVDLRTALEDLAWDLLARTHGGWENNEGGFGEFVFDVPARTITLEFNQRYAGCESYSHEF